jgi:hypothetical protein
MHLHARNGVLGRVLAGLVSLRSGENLEECRIGIRHRVAEGESAEEDGDAGQQTIEEIEGAYRRDADEIEQRPLDAQVREGFVQALKDPVPSADCRVRLYGRPSHVSNRTRGHR